MARRADSTAWTFAVVLAACAAVLGWAIAASIGCCALAVLADVRALRSVR